MEADPLGDRRLAFSLKHPVRTLDASMQAPCTNTVAVARSGPVESGKDEVAGSLHREIFFWWRSTVTSSRSMRTVRTPASVLIWAHAESLRQDRGLAGVG